MNLELKALLALAFAMVKSGKDAIEKKDFVSVILPDLYRVASDIPMAVQNIGQLQADIAALPGSAQEADLIAFLIAEVGGVTDDAKAKAVLAAVLKMISDVALDIAALDQALKA